MVKLIGVTGYVIASCSIFIHISIIIVGIIFRGNSKTMLPYRYIEFIIYVLEIPLAILLIRATRKQRPDLLFFWLRNEFLLTTITTILGIWSIICLIFTERFIETGEHTPWTDIQIFEFLLPYISTVLVSVLRIIFWIVIHSLYRKIERSPLIEINQPTDDDIIDEQSEN